MENFNMTFSVEGNLVEFSEMQEVDKRYLVKALLQKQNDLRDEVEYLRRLCIAQATQKDPDERKY